MTVSLDIEARVDGASFSLRQRVPLVVTLRNPGQAVVPVPDPYASLGDAMTLILRRPDGTEKRLSLNGLPLPPGSRQQVLNVPVLPGRDTVFTFNVAALFELSSPGDHAVTVEYTWAPSEKPARAFRSAALPFTLRRPAAPQVFEVVPAEAASRGFQAIVWSEPGTEALQLDEGQRLLEPFGARIVAPSPGSRAAVSTAAAGAPQMDRWIAWIADDRALVAAFASEDPAAAVAPRATPLPSGCRGGRLVTPALADDPPSTDVEPAPAPAACVGLLADSSGGGTDLVIADIDASGTATFRRPISMSADVASDQVLGAWATAPSAGARVFVLALPASGGVLLRGVAVQPFPGSTAASVDLALVDGDELLLGDVRADLQGRVWIGVLVRRGARWALVSFTPPVTDRDRDLRTEELSPGASAVASAVRLDTAGGLHVLYRSAGLCHYVPAEAKSALWTSARIAAKGSHEHLILRGIRGATIVYHDIELGLGIERTGL